MKFKKLKSIIKEELSKIKEQRGSLQTNPKVRKQKMSLLGTAENLNKLMGSPKNVTELKDAYRCIMTNCYVGPGPGAKPLPSIGEFEASVKALDNKMSESFRRQLSESQMLTEAIPVIVYYIGAALFGAGSGAAGMYYFWDPCNCPDGEVDTPLVPTYSNPKGDNLNPVAINEQGVRTNFNKKPDRSIPDKLWNSLNQEQRIGFYYWFGGWGYRNKASAGDPTYDVDITEQKRTNKEKIIKDIQNSNLPDDIKSILVPNFDAILYLLGLKTPPPPDDPVSDTDITE